MNIENLSDQEKSMHLAKLSGVYSVCVCGDPNCRESDNSEWFSKKLNLYDPANMAIAWRVLNWAVKSEHEIDDSKSLRNFYGYIDFGHLCREKIVKDLYLFMLPDEATRTWLDKILSLAIEAGMVKEESE